MIYPQQHVNAGLGLARGYGPVGVVYAHRTELLVFAAAEGFVIDARRGGIVAELVHKGQNLLLNVPGQSHKRVHKLLGYGNFDAVGHYLYLPKALLISSADVQIVHPARSA